MKLLIKYATFLLFLMFSLTGISGVCPDEFFVSAPANGWIDDGEAGIKDVPGVGLGTLFLERGQSQYNNLANVTSFTGARIVNGILKCLYDADVQLVTAPRFKFRSTQGYWKNGVCNSRVNTSCQFAY